jgi:transcriptional regulator with XRE-family HTH domain
MDLTLAELEQLKRLALAVRTRQVTQTQIATETGVHQSQVSRILSGNVRRGSPNARRLCRYAEGIAGMTPSGSLEDSLALAVHSIWDGSAAHAEAITDLLGALGRAQASFGRSV